MKTVKHIFENVIGVQSPSEIYKIYVEKLKSSGENSPRIYLSNALTSGGFRRDNTLTFDEAFKRNATLSDQIRNQLYKHGVLNPNELVFFPGDTKAFENWKQFEYNFFFGLTILGITDLNVVSKLESFVRLYVDMSGFINDRLIKEERVHSYQNLIDLIHQFITNNNIEVNPVKELIQLLDNDLSLGSWYESELAKKFGAKVKRVKVNKDATIDEEMNLILTEIIKLEGLGMDFFIDVDPDPNRSFVYLVEM